MVLPQPVIVLLSLLTLVLTSCQQDPLKGRLLLSGSSTLAPLVGKAVAQWKTLHPKMEVHIEAIGSDAGLERLVRYDDADLALMSRPLTQADKDMAGLRGKELVALPVAWDAICIVVPVSNTWARSLTRDQASSAFSTAELWSDLNPDWPSKPIHRFVLGPRSGTTDLFAQALLSGDKPRLLNAERVQSSEDDQILARGVSQVEGSIGFLGWTSIQNSRETLRVVALDGIEPSTVSIQDRSYALPRQLWLVGNRDSIQANLTVQSLLRFLYEQYPSLISGTGLIPLSNSERSKTF